MIKYPRTPHLPFSKGTTNDDKIIDESVLNNLLLNEVVVTVKLDGENTTGYHNGHIHARSLDSKNHVSRGWVKSHLSSKLINLPKGWRICGENVFARHSIHYKNLESYFYLFSIWDENNVCLNWETAISWAGLLDIKVVPILHWGTIDIQGLQSLITDRHNNDLCEGFVVRKATSFKYSEFDTSVAKYVRENHVQSDTHWMKQPLVKNEIKCKS